MALIGVMSDSHDNVWAVWEAARLFRDRNVEMVVHLGDIVAPFTLRALHEAGVQRLVAVYGNNCGERIGLSRTAAALGYEIEEWPHSLEVDGRRLLLVHGSGPPEKTIAMVEALATSQRWDAVLYGHTHRVDNRRIGDVLVLNPGETCGCLTGKKTVAILDTATMEAEVVTL